jgi:hypothetical protein
MIDEKSKAMKSDRHIKRRSVGVIEEEEHVFVDGESDERGNNMSCAHRNE